MSTCPWIQGHLQVTMTLHGQVTEHMAAAEFDSVTEVLQGPDLVITTMCCQQNGPFAVLACVSLPAGFQREDPLVQA